MPHVPKAARDGQDAVDAVVVDDGTGGCDPGALVQPRRAVLPRQRFGLATAARQDAFGVTHVRHVQRLGWPGRPVHDSKDRRGPALVPLVGQAGAQRR